MNFRKYQNPYKIGTKEYKKREEEILYSFKVEALSSLGIDGSSTADELYSLAWKYGHEGGLEEVFFHLKTLVSIESNYEQ